MPDVGEVAGQAARHNEHGVDPDLVPVACIARREALCGDCDPAQAIFVERPCGRLRGAALFDFDEGEHPAAAGDEVDFAARHTGSTSENPPAVQPQPPGGNRLRLAPARFGLLSA